MAQILVLGKNLTTGRSEAMTKLKVDNTNGQLVSSMATGTAPLSIASTTVVPNLNVDQVDGYDAADLFNLDHADVTGVLDSNHGGTNLDTSGSTGVPSISAGTWSVATYLALAHGGAGVSLAATGPGALVQASNGATITVETLDEVRGGTGQTTITAGDLLYGSAANTLSKLAKGTAGYVLTMGASVPAWATPAAPAAHAASHSENGSDEVLAENLGTATMSAGYFLVTDGTGGVSMQAGDLPPASSAQYSILVADASAGWVEDTGFKVTAGEVTTGAWKGTAVGAQYGGTGIATHAATGVPYVAAGTWATETLLDESRGGTGQNSSAWIGFPYFSASGTWARTNATIAAGDMVYASAINTLAHLAKGTADQFLRMNAGATAPEWDTIGLNELDGVTLTTPGHGDVLFRNATTWVNLGAGSAGTFLRANGAADPSWADPGAGYDWAAQADSGGPKTIADGETLDIAGGNGIVTALSGASTPYTNTITAVVDAVTGGNIQACNLTANGLGLDINAIAGTGLAADGSANLKVDTGSTVNFASDTPVWTFGNETTGEGLFVSGTPVDANHVVNKTYVDNAISGLLWKDPCDVRSLVGNAAIATINALGIVAGNAYVVTDAGQLTRGTLDVTAGDLVEDNGTIWVMIHQAVGGYVPVGTRAILAKTTALITPYTEGTDDNKIVAFTGASNTGADTGDAVNTAACLISDDTHVGYYDAVGFVFEYDTSVALSTWTQFTGAGQISAGAGLTKTGNTINVGDGSVGNINGLAVGANTLGAAVNNTTIEISSNLLAVKANSIGPSQVDETAAYTWTGAHDFQSTFKVDAISESTGDTGVTVDNCLIKNGFAARSYITGNDANTNAEVSTINVGEIVYHHTTDSTVKLANAAATATSKVIGVCHTAAAADAVCPYNQEGPTAVKFIGGLTGYNVGDPVWLSKTAGHATLYIASYTAGDSIVLIGYLSDTLDLSATTVLGEKGGVVLAIQEATLLA